VFVVSGVAAPGRCRPRRREPGRSNIIDVAPILGMAALVAPVAVRSSVPRRAASLSVAAVTVFAVFAVFALLGL